MVRDFCSPRVSALSTFGEEVFTLRSRRNQFLNLLQHIALDSLFPVSQSNPESRLEDDEGVVVVFGIEGVFGDNVTARLRLLRDTLLFSENIRRLPTFTNV